MKKAQKWRKFRHRVIRALAYPVVYLYARLTYGLSIDKKQAKGLRQALILYNHQTPWDQFFVGLTMDHPVYYLASEDIFSNGWVSSLIRYIVAPIPIKKQTADVKAIITCIKVAREGGSIAIAPEGNRTYSGKTEYINPSIAALARKLGLPIAFVRLEGGYGVQPRWSDVVRRGRMSVRVSRVMSPEEYGALSDEELYETVCRELYVNEACADPGVRFRHKKAAEYLERAIYVCPRCGLSVFESHNDVIRCTKCQESVRYLPTKELERVGAGERFPFRFVNDWYEYQQDFVNRLDVTAADCTEQPLFRDTASVFRVVVYHKKQRLKKEVGVSLYGDRLTFDSDISGHSELSFDQLTAMAVLGRNKLNLYDHDNVYQLKGGKRFNALKYINLYYRYSNLTKETKDGKFLGL